MFKYKKSFIYIMYNCIYTIYKIKYITIYKIKYITIYNTMENYKTSYCANGPNLNNKLLDHTINNKLLEFLIHKINEFIQLQ